MLFRWSIILDQHTLSIKQLMKNAILLPGSSWMPLLHGAAWGVWGLCGATAAVFQGQGNPLQHDLCLLGVLLTPHAPLLPAPWTRWNTSGEQGMGSSRGNLLILWEEHEFIFVVLNYDYMMVVMLMVVMIIKKMRIIWCRLPEPRGQLDCGAPQPHHWCHLHCCRVTENSI